MEELVVTKEQLQDARIEYLAAINIYARILNVQKEGDYTHFPKELVNKMLPRLEKDATEATKKYQELDKNFKKRFESKIISKPINTKDVLNSNNYTKINKREMQIKNVKEIDKKSLLQPANIVSIKLPTTSKPKPKNTDKNISTNDFKDLLKSAQVN